MANTESGPVTAGALQRELAAIVSAHKSSIDFMQFERLTTRISREAWRVLEDAGTEVDGTIDFNSVVIPGEIAADIRVRMQQLIP